MQIRLRVKKKNNFNGHCAKSESSSVLVSKLFIYIYILIRRDNEK